MTCSFNSKKNKYGYFRGDEYIKSLCEKFEELVLEIIKYKEEKMIPLTDDENKFYKEEEVCHICRKHFCTNKKNYRNVRDHCHFTEKFRGAAHNICNLRYKVSKEISAIAHDISSYDTHFTINQLAEKFESKFYCIGENIGKYITFSVAITDNDDDDDDDNNNDEMIIKMHTN